MAIRFENLAPVITLSSYERRPRPPDHFVEFYGKDADLADTVLRFASSGVASGDSVVLVMTGAHRELIEQHLSEVDLAKASGRICWVDANEALDVFMRGELIDQEGFKSHFGDLIRSAGAEGRKVRVFGEMVAVLWTRGNTAAALQLEDLWNQLAKTVEFRLFCAYPTNVFSDTNLGPLRSVCGRHTHVLAGAEATV